MAPYFAVSPMSDGLHAFSLLKHQQHRIPFSVFALGLNDRVMVS
jgi:hypothetical protein